VETVVFTRGPYRITTDKTELDLAIIHDYLSRESYWASGRTLATVRRTVEHSLCFGLFADGSQVGFSRVVADYATFAWLGDVFVLPSHRGLGLGKWMIECVVAHPAIRDIRLALLATRDAHGLYERYGGFAHLEAPGRWMARWNRAST
jgi:GNAT superfamily N-acetyltransferase